MPAWISNPLTVIHKNITYIKNSRSPIVKKGLGYSTPRFLALKFSERGQGFEVGFRVQGGFSDCHRRCSFSGHCLLFGRGGGLGWGGGFGGGVSGFGGGVSGLRARVWGSLLSGYNYNYINNCRQKSFAHVPLFPIGQTINYNYITNCLENYFCCQGTITITRIIPLRIIYVVISWPMVQAWEMSGGTVVASQERFSWEYRAFLLPRVKPVEPEKVCMAQVACMYGLRITKTKMLIASGRIA